MNKRIIIVGAAAAGKDYLKKKFGKQGFELDVSYTTRPIREEEVDGVDYHFISEKEFHELYYDMYETAKHGNYWYGTGLFEWNNFDIFIMETHGISEITEEDRKNCFIIYLNPEINVRKKRMRRERKWSSEAIAERIETDSKKFKGFVDYDIMIANSNF